METADASISNAPKTSGMAIASLITALTCLSPLAIIFGHVALAQIIKSGKQSTGFGLALAGTILGYVGLTLMGLATLFIGARAWQRNPDRPGCIMNIRNVQQAVRDHQQQHDMSVGDPIDWNLIFSPDGYMNKPICPAGGTYTFTNTIPPIGTVICQCSHADHVPTNTSTW